MANIKIAQLTNQTAISNNDLIIVETATSTNKMTVGKLKELLGIQVGGVIENVSGPNGTYIKYADGTLISYRSIGFTYSGYFEVQGDSIVASWTFPHAYAGAPPAVVANVFSTNYAPLWRASLSVIPTVTQSEIMASIPGYEFNPAHSLTAFAIAIGRWY